MTFNKHDIDTLQKAKEYPHYHGGALSQTEKDLFNSPLLTPDGTLDVSLLQDTAQLLNHWKQGKEQVKTERMGLTSPGATLLNALLIEQKANSLPYQVVNSLDNKQPVDQLVSQFEDILFSETDTIFEEQIKAKLIFLNKLREGKENKLQEIRKLEAEEEKIKTHAKNVNTIVTRLKNDLKTPKKDGRKFFELTAKYNKLVANEAYKSDTPPSTESGFETYGSAIKTGYNGSGKPYTHVIYLIHDLQGQVWTILKELDKDKLFAYIDSAECSWTRDANGNDQKKKFKKTFSRVVDLKLEFQNAGDKTTMGHLKNNGYIRANQETYRYLSDIFYIMHALFPKDSNYKDSPFLKKGQKSCLQFNDTNKSIDTPYKVYWRGADASIKGVRYADFSPSIMKAPFPCEEKTLTWANGQIPEFFWQVYNNDEAIQFTAFHEVLGPDAVSYEKVREEEITVYEKKVKYSFSTALEVSESNIYTNYLDINYCKHVESLIQNTTDADGKLLIGVGRFRGEWEYIAEEMMKDFSGRTMATFSQSAKAITYDDLRSKISEFRNSTVKLIEKYKGGGVDQVTENDVINKWDKWNEITKTKKTKVEASLGEVWSKLEDISQKIDQTEQELNAIENAIKKAKEGRLEGLRKTFKEISVKTSKTYQEVLFLRSILGLVERYEKIYPADPDFNVATLRQELDDEQKAIEGILTDFNKWMKLGENLGFRGRLEKWKKSDGLYHNQEAEMSYFRNLVNALCSVGVRLDPDQQNELAAIEVYLANPDKLTETKLTPMRLRLLLGITTNIFRGHVQKWIDFSSSFKFGDNPSKIEELASKANNNKVEFVKFIKETLSKKPGLPKFPDGNASEQDILNWFFLLDPSIVIETIASQELAADSSLKAQILQQMQDYKAGEELLNREVYGNGQEFTEAGIAKYYAEKLGGQNHATRKYDQPFQDSSQALPFWRWTNPGAIFSGLGLLLLLGGSIWAWRQRKALATWWNQPAEEEGDELDEEEW